MNIEGFQQQLKRNREIDVKIEHNVSSTAIFCTTHSKHQNLKSERFFAHCTIFTSTIQRISDLIVNTASFESYSVINP